MLQKVFSLIYIFGGIALIGIGIMQFMEAKESYGILFGIETNSKYKFLIFRIIFGALVIWAGISRLLRKETL